MRQSVTFRASANDVYVTLIDLDKYVRFTGDEASISLQAGGCISAYGGYIEGVNLELVPDCKIVQSWRASDWPESHYSKFTFSLGGVAGGTRLGVPYFENIEGQ